MTGLVTRLAADLRATDAGTERRALLRRLALGRDEIDALLAETRAWARRDPAKAARTAQAAHLAARLTGDAALAARCARLRGQVLILLGRPRGALAHLRRAAAGLPAAQRADLAPELARCLGELGREGEARALLASAREAIAGPHRARRLALVDLAEAALLQRLDGHEQALALLERARRRLARLGPSPLLTAVDADRANVLGNLERHDRAERIYQRVVRDHLARGQDASARQVEYNQAYLQFLRGRFHHALTRFRDLKPSFEALGDRRHVALCDLDQAEINLRLNLPDQAHGHATRAAKVLDELGLEQDAVRARFFAAVAGRNLGKEDEARAGLDRALADFQRLGCVGWAAICRAHLADAARRAGRLDEAQADALRAACVLQELGLLERAGRADLLAASVELERGHPEAALERLAAIRERLVGVHAPWLVCASHHQTALALEALGQRRGALKHALRAARLLERHRVAVPPDEYMAAFLRDKASIHRDAVRLVLTVGGRRAWALAFEIAERAQGRALLDLLRDGAGPRDTAARERLRERVEELEREIDGLQGRMPSTEPHQRLGAARRVSRELEVRERRLSLCLDELAVRRPDRAGDPMPDIADIHAALPADTTLLKYFVLPGELCMFVVSGGHLHLVRRPLAEQELAGCLARVRFHLDRSDAVLRAYQPAQQAAITAAAEAALDDLGALLVEPIRPLLKTRRLVVVPHADLHAVPFHALTGGDGRALIEDMEVVRTPSVAVYLHGLRRPPCANDEVLALGVADENAPLIADEVRAVAATHCGDPVRMVLGAERAALAEHGPRARLLHVATHASYRGDDPMLSGLLMADGWMTISDIYGLGLDADLLVLSGCATGRVWVTEGDDVFGLTRGFLRAGVRSLLSSLWRVSDESASHFMQRFHAALAAGDHPSAALRRAIRETRTQFPHPHHWAAFVLTGAGGPNPCLIAIPGGDA